MLRGIDGQTGNVFTPQLEAVLWHEMMHIMYGELYPQTAYNIGSPSPAFVWEDPGEPGLSDSNWVDDYDFVGAMVRAEIQVSIDLGLPYRPNYTAMWMVGDPGVPEGDDFTGGKAVDLIIRGSVGNDVVDLENRTGPGGALERQLVFGGDGSDRFALGGGNDFGYGEDGADWFIGGDGEDYLYGDAGRDIASYEDSEAVRITYTVMGSAHGHGGEAEGDRLYDIETIIGSDGDDVVEIDFGINSELAWRGSYASTLEKAVFDIGMTGWSFPLSLINVETLKLSTSEADTLVLTNIPGGGSELTVYAGRSPGVIDSLNLSGLDGGVKYTNGRLTDGNLFSFEGKLVFREFDQIIFGDGNDRIWQDESGSTIYLGKGEDTLLYAATGTVVYGGGGADRFHLHDNVRIMDASAEDHISYAGLADLTGGLRYIHSSNPFAMHASFVVGYAMNEAGDLVIHDFIRDRDMFIANYQSELTGGVNTAGIHVAEYDIGVYNVAEPKPSNLTWMGTWELMMGHYVKANLGVSLWNGVDPLVLDLDGDGLELTGLSTYVPFFDYDGDGYGERGGWVSRDDGILVLDVDADGQVSDVGELFGGPGLSGFAELATHDLNLDGVINASDAVYGQLSVWRDLNQNRVVDAGEMVSLSSLGITAIEVTGTASTATVNGNAVIATGGFTRADGSTGVAGDIGFRVDQQRTQWLGDSTVGAAAAALPELRGFGTLTNLRVAMTLDPTLQTVAATLLPTLDTLDLATMRNAVLPLFTAWAAASPITETVPLGGHDDVPVLTMMVDGQRVITDYAYQAINTETGLTEWRRASTGVVIPDLQELLGAPQTDPDAADWSELSGAWIDFFERYLGEALPIGREPVSGEGAASGLQGVISGMWQTVDLLTVRLAMQGPLSEYFEGVRYDVSTDTFRPTTERQLIPVFEAVFEEVAAMTSGGIGRLESWREILDIVIGDYRQPDGVLNTNGFLFSNIVAAYESTGLNLNIVDIGEALGLPAELIRTGLGTVTGGDDADLFYLGAGDQIAVGGLGPDTYVVGRGFGHDVIDDIEPVLTTHAEDVVRFADIASTEVTATRDGLDLVLTVNGTTDELRIVDHFDGRLPGFGGGGDLSSSTGVDFILFADGVKWTPFDIARAVSRSTSGADTILGTETVDWLDGGAGDDFLSGGNDSDVYVYGHGYGNDVISDQNGHIYLAGPDYLSFTDGITISDLHFSRNGGSDDLLITIDGQEGSVTLVDQWAATYTGVFGTFWLDQIEGFLFDDGSDLGWQDVAMMLLEQARTDGADTIYGFSLEDRLDGGAGDDFMSGGNENDTYVFGSGYGHDTIHEQWSNILSGGIDVVEFTPETLPADVAFTRDGDDLIVTITATGDTLRVRDQYVVTETGTLGTHAFNQIEHFRFSDGTVLNWPDIRTAIIEASQTPGDDLVLGTHFDDLFQGGTGDDRIEGGNGGDTYRFNVGDGADTIRDHLDNLFTDRNDTVVFGEGISADDIVITRYGSESNSVHLAIGATGDSVSIEQQFAYTTIALKEFEVERFSFDDGTLWTANDLRLHYLAQVQTSGNDNVLGFWTDDQIEGGSGNDVLRGWDGSDTYRFDLGFGVDEIREFVDNVSFEDDDAVIFGAGLVSTDAVFTRNGDDLTISFDGLSDQVTIFGQFETQAFYAGWRDIETFTFGDSVVLTDAQIRVLLLAQASTSSDDVITGFSSVADIIDGGAGNDTLRGLGGGDTYLFGTGSGQDLIQETIGSLYEDQPDTLQFAAGIDPTDVTFTRDGMDLLVTLAGSTDSVRIQDHFGSSGYASVEQFAFDGGLVISKAEVSVIVLANQSTSGDDLIIGTAGDDVITGGAGNDVLRGGDGADTYHFETGFGTDVIDENVDNVAISDFDVIEFGAGLLAADAVLSRDGDDLVISFPTGDSLRVLRQFEHLAYHEGWEDIEEVRFHSGEVWTQADLRERLLELASTAGDDSITGYWGADAIDGGAGNDEIHGLGGDDVYAFGLGSGHDTVHETFDTYEDRFDTIAFKAGVSPTDVVFTRDGDDLVATLTGGVDSLTIRDFFLMEQREVEAFTFPGGASLDRAQVSSLALAAQATEGNDTVLGSWRADVLSGAEGADQLSGGGGGDTYQYAAGDGRDVITDNGDGEGDSIALGAGITTANVLLYRSGGDLVIEVGGGDENAIVVRGHFTTTAGRIETLVFADGTTWGLTEIETNLQTLPAGELRGTFADDQITGSASAEILIGREGDDVLAGEGGSDIYVYVDGDGSDAVSDTSTSATDTDVLQLADFAPGDVQMRRVGSDLIISLPDDVITVSDHFYQGGAGRGVELIEFAGGVTWDRTAIGAAAWMVGTVGTDILTGDSGVTTFQGGLGDDVLTGGAGDDAYRYASGDGADRIVENPNAGADLLHLTDLDPADIVLTRVGDDLMLRDQTTGQTIEIDNHFLTGPSGEGYGVESIRFADGSQWDRAAIVANTWISGTTGVDNLGGSSGEDNLFGDLGDDILQAGAGADVYLYRSGDGSDRIEESSAVGADVLKLADIDPLDVMLTRSGVDLYVKDLTTGQSIRVNNQFSTAVGNGYGIETLRFGNGVEWGRAEIADNVWVAGTTGVDNLGGSAGDDRLFGDLGDDILQAGAGADVYLYRSGDGSDRIEESSATGADLLKLADLDPLDVMLTRNGSDLYVKDLTTGQSIRVNNQFSTATGNGYGIETLRFGDGTEWTRADIAANVWVVGTTGVDNIGGGSGDDRLFGDLGDDILQGGAGADVYRYRSGDGSDRIEDSSATGADVLHLVDLDASEVALTKIGDDVYIKDIATGQSIRINYQIAGGVSGNGYGIETLRFGDGTEWNRADIAANAWIRGTTGADNFGGTSGNDTMFGDLGADRLGGGAGADTYIYRSGDGADTVAEDSGVGADVLFLTNLNIGDVSITRSGSDLMVQDLSTGQSIKVEYHFWSGTTGNGYGIETIKFADGTTWNRQQISDEVNGLSGMSMSNSAARAPVILEDDGLLVGWDEASDAFLGDWQREVKIEDGLLIIPDTPEIETSAFLEDDVILSGWNGEAQDAFIVSEDIMGPMSRPTELEALREGQFGQDWRFTDWQLTVLEDGTIGAPLPNPHLDIDRGWMF